ncbi:uncharacterized protein BCR38DRAFT_353415, partial [Pseudomassariella vexata]
CFVQSIPQSPCGYTNATCLCNDPILADIMKPCMLSNCTVKESLTTKNLSTIACGSPVTKPVGNVIQDIALIFVVATIFFTARMAAKISRYTNWGLDDFTIVLSYVIILIIRMPCLNLIIPTVLHNGQGMDIWVLSHDKVANIIKVCFVTMTILYNLDLTLIKGSILFFYLRVFSDKHVRQILWATQAFNLMFGILSLILAVLKFQPAIRLWDRWDKETPRTSAEYMPFLKAQTIIHIVMDALMIIIPATQLYNLNMPPRQKIGILIMFGLGIFLTILSGIRIKIVPTTLLITCTAVSPWSMMWPQLELGTGIVIACLPSARQLCSRLLPKVSHFYHQISICSRRQQDAYPEISTHYETRSSKDATEMTISRPIEDKPYVQGTVDGTAIESRRYTQVSPSNDSLMTDTKHEE